MRFSNTIFLLFFFYTIAALVFWGVSLNNQSERIYEQELVRLRLTGDSLHRPAEFKKAAADILRLRRRRQKQYMGEGGTFIVIICIGAAIVYTSFRRSIRLSKQQNNFMLSVTHELKSPIAAVKLNLQTLQRHNLDDEKRNLIIGRSVKEATRLNDLCNNMLLASQMEGRQYQPVHELLDMAELVSSSVSDYNSRYPRRFIPTITSEPLTIMGDRLMLQMAVNNLLENAVKYAPADKPVLVQLQCKSRQAALAVIDLGPGIPDAEKAKVFRKFYRVGNEATRRSKGTGLGLYLAQKIVKQHQGKITLTDNQPNGAIFEVCLPLDKRIVRHKAEGEAVPDSQRVVNS